MNNEAGQYVNGRWVTDIHHDAATREQRMVVIERDLAGRPTIWCDPEIADLVTALNKCGIPTVASCSGHGRRPGIISLKDGRELLVLPDYDSARLAEKLFGDG